MGWLVVRPALLHLTLAGWIAIVIWIGTTAAFPLMDGSWPRLLFRKSVHIAEYGVLGFLFYAALTGGSARFRPTRALVAIALAVAVASADEWHQSFMPFRAGLASDVAIDAFGAGLGQAFAFALARIRGGCGVV